MHAVYSAGDHHLIVGREKEEQAIKEQIEQYMRSDGGIIYICGHPGQGKTVVLQQVLHDYFESTQNKNVVVFNYNAMTFDTLQAFLDKFLSEIPSESAKHP